MLKRLMDYCPNALPMHMPGHKRNTNLAQYLLKLNAGIDITEIDGFDDLHAPEGIILASQENAQKLWGSGKSVYLVGGSTCGILSAVYALGFGKETCVIARNAHKSVYHALELMDLRAKFVYPEFDRSTGMLLSVSPESVEQALSETPGAAFVLVTSPTYEGVISDIKRIADIAHEHGAKLIVDEAHGAHLGLNGHFPDGAVKAGADVVIQSLHKTLPSLTQTAIMHIRNQSDERMLMHALDIFESSSPSYLLMASIDGCIKLLSERGEEIFASWRRTLDMFYEGAKALTKIRVLRPCGKNVFAFDDGKILISSGTSGMSGSGIMKRLRENYGIELEAAYERYAVAMTGAGDTEKTLERLLSALLSIDKGIDADTKEAPALAYPKAEAVMPVKEALKKKSEFVSALDADGCVSAEYAWAYPPGIPLIAPGEIITEEIINAFSALRNSGIKTVTTGGRNGYFSVVAESGM
ncbi:MAG: aminotransferase class V-fold PLP-dependent enzyme [Clostridia bacterium]|nr:aminotransferase class V-fold PLP-dependent enzyme [Clostridia bacterium]